MAIRRQSLGVKKIIRQKNKPYKKKVDMGQADDRMARRMGNTGAVTTKFPEIKEDNAYYIGKKIALIYDEKGWAFYNKSNNIKKYLNKYYRIDILKHNENFKQDLYNIIVCYSPACIPKTLSHFNNVICGISSHIGLEQRIMGLNKFKYSFSNDFDIFQKLKTEKKFYVPNGINLEFFNGRLRKLQNKTINIATIGSNGRRFHKGEERLKQICNRLLDLGYNVNNLSLFSNPRSGEILTQEDMLKFYNDVDIYIVSSVSEATPNPLLEAMALGIPCISNNTGMANLLIENGKSGYIINDYNDIDSYVNNIISLIENPKLYEKFSKNGLIKIKEFDWKEMALGYKKMFDDFLGIEDIEDDVTIIIKTFDRPTTLKKSIESIRKFYNNISILVVNDGNEDVNFINEFDNIRLIDISYDSGISMGRNIGVKNVKTKYFVVCDDDFIFTDETKLDKLYKILENSNLDIIGGHVNSDGIHMGVFSEEEKILSLNYGNIFYDDEHGYYGCHFIRNFFMAKKESFLKHKIKWDNDLKMGEHTLFYYNLWKKNISIGYYPNVTVENYKEIPNNEYLKMRRRADVFTNKNLHKYGLKIIKRKGEIINHAE